MFKNVFMLVILGLSAVSFSGCIFLAAGAAGAGTAKWLSDKVSQEVNAPADKVAQSAKAVFKDSNMDLTKEVHTPQVIQIRGKYNDGREVWVDVRPLTANTATLDVRVGWVNGEADARKLLEQILKKATSWI
jgi:hypothetical protein